MSHTSDNNTQAGALHTGEDSFYMDPVLYTGRPADCTGRLEKEIRTYDLLDELQIPYWRLDPPPLTPAMTWMSGWTLRSARTCFSAMPRKPIFICS